MTHLPAVSPLGLPAACPLCRNIYGRTSDVMLRQLWHTRVINMFYGFSNPRIDNW